LPYLNIYIYILVVVNVIKHIKKWY